MKRKQSDHSLMSFRDYGEVTLKLKEFMVLRQINRNQLARQIGVRFEVINKWYNNDLAKLDLDILARICNVLDCSIEDLLEYHRADDNAPRSNDNVPRSRGNDAVGSYLRVAEAPAGTYDTTH